MNPILTTESLRVGYRGGVDILHDFNLSVPEGEITGIIGSNGAGKSTLLKTLFGVLDPREGGVTYKGSEITRSSTHARKLAGISYLPQHHSVFSQMTVEENLRLGGWVGRRERQALRARLEYLYTLFPILSERRNTKATSLSGGQQRMLAVAKELVIPPRLLLVDEPSVGMSPDIAARVYELLNTVAKEGITVVLVDQNVSAAIEISHHVHLIDRGTLAISDTSSWFRDNIREVTERMLHSPVEQEQTGGNGVG